MVLWGWVSCFDCFLSCEGGTNVVDWLDLSLDLMILNVDELVLDELLYECNAWICVDCGCTSLDWFHCLSVLSNLFLLFLMLPISYAQWFGYADCHSLIPLYSLMESMLSAYYAEVCILYPQYHDYDAGLWLTLSSDCLMLLYVSCNIQTSLLVVLWLPSGLMLILWSLVYVCLRVDCLVICRMWELSKCMLWAWSTHGVRGRHKQGWLDCWEWIMVVWLQSVVFACRANWPCVDVLLRSLKSHDWQ